MAIRGLLRPGIRLLAPIGPGGIGTTPLVEMPRRRCGQR
jgi:hypothetical protein